MMKLCMGCGGPNNTRYKYCQEEVSANCLTCNSDFTYKCSSRTPFTCGKSCGSKLIMKNRQANNEVRECKCCGDSFSPNSFNSKYCLQEKIMKCLYEDCDKEYKIICNNDYSNYCSETCCKKDMRGSNYKLSIKNCILCGGGYTPTSSRQKTCGENHYNNCLFCGESFLVTSMFNAIERNKYCDNVCSSFAQKNSTINRSLVSEYKDINNWAKEFFTLNNRRPNAVDVKEYFSFKKLVSLKEIPNIDLVLFDYKKNYSNLENILEEYLKYRYSEFKYIHNYRHKFDDGKILEIDFYIPELKIGFEVQDFGTHDRYSDDVMGKWDFLKKGPTYHENKRGKYFGIGIKIIEIWQDELFDGSYKSVIATFLDI